MKFEFPFPSSLTSTFLSGRNPFGFHRRRSGFSRATVAPDANLRPQKSTPHKTTGNPSGRSVPVRKSSRKLPIHFLNTPEARISCGSFLRKGALPSKKVDQLKKLTNPKSQLPFTFDSFRSFRFKMLPTWLNDTPFRRKDCRGDPRSRLKTCGFTNGSNHKSHDKWLQPLETLLNF